MLILAHYYRVVQPNLYPLKKKVNKIIKNLTSFKNSRTFVPNKKTSNANRNQNPKRHHLLVQLFFKTLDKLNYLS